MSRLERKRCLPSSAAPFRLRNSPPIALYPLLLLICILMVVCLMPGATCVVGIAVAVAKAAPEGARLDVIWGWVVAIYV